MGRDAGVATVLGVSAQTLLLGPQRRQPSVRDAVSELGPDGPVVAITAGWEERESEDLELEQHLDCEVRNLELWGRGENVFQHDPELFGALLERFDRLRRVHELYRLRLQHLSPIARQLLSQEGDDELFEPEREAAIGDLRRLDEHLLGRIASIHEAFVERWNPRGREHVVRQREEIAQRLDGASVLCIAGGHVGVLLSRMRLFDVLGLWGDRPVVAWSAGAMVLTDRVVLFHDHPPDGESHAAEVLEPGFGRCPGLVPLPHARHRLELDDPGRVARFARRFGPALCVPLDEGEGLRWDGAEYRAWKATRQMMISGKVEAMR